MQFLNRIRKPEKKGKSKSVRASILIFLLGIALGIISKWLDGLGLDSAVWWQRAIEKMRLPQILSELPVWVFLALVFAVYSSSALKAAVNAFLLFAGSCAAYHIWSVVFSGFDPGSYMLIWYALTILSPFLAAVCWYAKGKGAVPVIIDTLIIAVMYNLCFAVGWIYVGFKGIFEALLFAAVIAVLYRDAAQAAISLAAGTVIGFLICRLPVFPK